MRPDLTTAATITTTPTLTTVTTKTTATTTTVTTVTAKTTPATTTTTVSTKTTALPRKADTTTKITANSTNAIMTTTTTNSLTIRTTTTTATASKSTTHAADNSTTAGSASGSQKDDDDNSPLGVILGALGAVVIIAWIIGVLVVLKKRSAAADKRPGNAHDPNAATVDNAVFAFPGNGGAAPGNSPAPDYHIPDFGDGNNTTNPNAATSEPDYDEVQGVLGNQSGGGSGGAEPDYQDATDIGNQAAAVTADPNYADASSLLPRSSLQASASAGDYDDVDFEGAARFNGLPPNAISNAPMYDKQPANNAARPASLYDVMVDDGVGAAPRSVQMIRGSAAQVPSERNNGASEVFGETHRHAAMF